MKAEELICCLLMELVQWPDRSLHSINPTDVKALYAIRDRLLSNLVEAPPLLELAQLAGMSLRPRSEAKPSYKTTVCYDDSIEKLRGTEEIINRFSP